MGSPRSFGWQMLLGAGTNDRELWETPTGEQYWLETGARLERSPDPDVTHRHMYTVLSGRSVTR